MSKLRERIKRKLAPASFKQNLVSYDAKLERCTFDEGRYYMDEDGEKYLSVTTVLGVKKNEGLAAWRKWVGEEEADWITKISAERGTHLHEICENYVLNRRDATAGFPPDGVRLFAPIKPVLDRNIREVIGCELQMKSKTLNVAGTSDLIANWGGQLAIVDFKNARKHKKKEHTLSYHYQGAAYCRMAQECLGLNVNKFVIVIAVENEHHPQIFYGDYNEYIHKFEDMAKEANDLLGNLLERNPAESDERLGRA